MASLFSLLISSVQKYKKLTRGCYIFQHREPVESCHEHMERVFHSAELLQSKHVSNGCVVLLGNTRIIYVTMNL